MHTIENLTTEKHIHQIIVPVRVQKRSLLDRLLRRPVETERTLTFYPCVVANQYRVVDACMQLPNELWQQEYLNLPLLFEHQTRIVYIVAAALQNNYLEPSPALIKFLERNLSGEQLSEALAASVKALCLNSFLESIVLLKPTARILDPDAEPVEQLTELTNLKN